MRRVAPCLVAIPMILSCAGCGTGASVHPERRDIVDAVFAVGHVTTSHEYYASANAEGFLERSHVSEGDSVEMGETLFRIAKDTQETQLQNAANNYSYAAKSAEPDAPEIVLLETQIAQASRQCQQDSLNLARQEILFKASVSNQTELEKAQLQYQSSVANLQVLQQSLADLKTTLAQNRDAARMQYLLQQQNTLYFSVRAARAAEVLTVYKKDGEYVRRGENIAKLGSGTVLVRLQVAEEDIGRIKPGQPALISLNTMRDSVFVAEVTRIYPALDPESQAFIVYAEFTRLPSDLKAGAHVQANIVVAEKRGALVVPSEYADPTGHVSLRGSHRRIPVKVGIRTVEWTEIEDGVTEQSVLVMPVSP